MMSEASKPKVETASLTVPETFTDKFKCIKCKKYLRPPIWIVCESGHNVCDLCRWGSSPACAACEKWPKKIRNFLVEDSTKVC